MKLGFTYRALTDLNRLRAFVAKDNPHAARRVSQALLRSIHYLVDHPHIGHLLDEQDTVRVWVAGDYVVHYLCVDQEVTVLRVWHGKEQRAED